MEKAVQIRSVWAHNVALEFSLIERCLLSGYRFASMDTEFPGVIFHSSVGQHHSQLNPSQNYQLMKSNVDALNLIQVGITLSNTKGNLPDFGTNLCYIWEFNLSDFDVDRDPHNKDSIEMLKSQGIDFQHTKNYGIDSGAFAWLLVKHGLALNRYDGVTWITFHGSYDFGFLLKVLTRNKLPDNLGNFMKLMNVFFGLNVFDAKHMTRFCKGLYGGLEKISKTLGVERSVGKSHQAGSDSLLTLRCFMKIVEKYSCVDQTIINDPFALKNVLFGLENRFVRTPISN